MQFLRANTEVIVTVGPFVDVGDGFTPQIDITLGGDEAELIKHGSTAVVSISGATWAAVASCRGYYSLTLTTALTNTEGLLAVIVQDDSDCLPVKQEYMVLSEAAWDSMFVAKDTGFMDVNVKAISEDTSAADNLEAACDNYSVTRGLTGTALPAAVAEAAGGLYTQGTGAGQINQHANGAIDVNTKYINDSAGAAIRLALSAGQIIPFTVDDTPFSPTTVAFEADDVPELTTSHYVGRLILWTTGDLAGQMNRITQYSFNSPNGLFGTTLMTEAPANNDTGVIM